MLTGYGYIVQTTETNSSFGASENARKENEGQSKNAQEKTGNKI